MIPCHRISRLNWTPHQYDQSSAAAYEAAWVEKALLWGLGVEQGLLWDLEVEKKEIEQGLLWELGIEKS